MSGQKKPQGARARPAAAAAAAAVAPRVGTKRKADGDADSAGDKRPKTTQKEQEVEVPTSSEPTLAELKALYEFRDRITSGTDLKTLPTDVKAALKKSRLDATSPGVRELTSLWSVKDKILQAIRQTRKRERCMEKVDGTPCRPEDAPGVVEAEDKVFAAIEYADIFLTGQKFPQISDDDADDDDDDDDADDGCKEDDGDSGDDDSS